MSNVNHIAQIEAALDAGYDPLDDWEYLSQQSRESIDYHLTALASELGMYKDNLERVQRHLQYAVAERDSLLERQSSLIAAYHELMDELSPHQRPLEVGATIARDHDVDDILFSSHWGEDDSDSD